jgi:hypothetical protein
MNKSFTVAKINFKNIKLAGMITGITIAGVMAQDIIYLILALFNVYPGSGSSTVGMSNFFYLLIILSAVFIPCFNFRKMVNLGAKRNNFFTGCFITYAIMAAAVSLAGLLFYYIYEIHVIPQIYNLGTLHVLIVFGWLDNGVIVAFFQQFAFLFLGSVFIHTLTAAQDKWYGWIADIIIVAILAVFIPIASLRTALIWFFNITIFHSNAFIQIAACFILAVAVYMLNKLILSRKII